MKYLTPPTAESFIRTPTTKTDPIKKPRCFLPVYVATVAALLAVTTTVVSRADDRRTSSRVFGPLIELEVPDDRPGAAFIVDLDTARFFSPPSKLWERGQRGDFAEIKKWITSKGIDAFGEGGDDGLIGHDMIARPIDGPVAWRFPDVPVQLTIRLIDQMVVLGDPGTPISLNAKGGVGPRATYLFKTREGAGGVLQIVGWDSSSQSVSVRYLLLRDDAEPAAETRPQSSNQDDSKRGHSSQKFDEFGPIRKRTLNSLPVSNGRCMIDFESGKLFPAEKEQKGLKFPQYIHEHGIDAYPKPYPVHHTLKAVGMSVVRVPAAVWSNAGKSQRGLEVLSPTYGGRYIDMPANKNGEPPATYLFKTREGSLGIMQIVEIDDASRTAKIQYRLRRDAKKLK
jgi:hypothetical protein